MQRIFTALSAVVLVGLGACTVHHHHHADTQGQAQAAPAAAQAPMYDARPDFPAQRAPGDYQAAPGAPIEPGYRPEPYDNTVDPFAQHSFVPRAPSRAGSASSDCDCDCDNHRSDSHRSDSRARSDDRRYDDGRYAPPRGPASLPTNPVDLLE